MVTYSGQPITRICITGGPCSGKTTALATIHSVLTKQGFKVFIVPEAESLIGKGGGGKIEEGSSFSLYQKVRFLSHHI
jgi:putative protein kinase ArgK-like GTPase of G3E family